MMNNAEVINKIKNKVGSVPKEELFGNDMKDYENFKGLDAKAVLKMWQNLLDKNTDTNSEDYEWRSINGEYFKAIRTNENDNHKFDLLARDNYIYYGCYPETVSDGKYKDGVLSFTFNLSSENVVECFDIDLNIEVE